MFERCLYFNSNALVRKVNALMEARYNEFGLTPPQAYLLRLINIQGPASQQQIAQELKLEKSTVTRLVKKMETAGWLERGDDQEDTRKKMVFATVKAKAIAAKLEKQGDAMYKKLTGILGEKEMKSFVADIRNVYDQL